MSLILNIETSSLVCSVSLGRDGILTGLEEISDKANHAAMLTVMIEHLMSAASIALSDIDAVAVSAGPGSYTGLRIGTATAKGLCYALSKPLISIDSLQALAYGMFNSCKQSDVYYCPTIDARRQEIYYGIYEREAITVKPSVNVVAYPGLLNEYLEKRSIIIGGSGSGTCRSILRDDRIHYDEQTPASAAWMLLLSEKKWKAREFVDLSSFEPNYIKPAFITERKNKLL